MVEGPEESACQVGVLLRVTLVFLLLPRYYYYNYCLLYCCYRTCSPNHPVTDYIAHGRTYHPTHTGKDEEEGEEKSSGE